MYALSLVTLIQLLHLVTLGSIAEWIFDIGYPTKPVAIVLLFGLGGLNYYRYGRTYEQCRKIAHKWNDEPPELRHRRAVYLVILIIASLLAIVLIGEVNRNG
jgi:hypothetical protein